MLRSAWPCPAVGGPEKQQRGHTGNPGEEISVIAAGNQRPNGLPSALVIATLAGADGPERRTRHGLAANLWVTFRLPHGLGRTIGLDSPQERIAQLTGQFAGLIVNIVLGHGSAHFLTRRVHLPSGWGTVSVPWTPLLPVIAFCVSTSRYASASR